MRERIIFFILLGLYLILLLDVTTIVGFFRGIEISVKHIKNITVVLIAIYCILIVLSSIFSPKVFKIILYIATIPFAILNVIMVWYVLFYGGFISLDDINAMMRTNTEESSSFISNFFNYKILLSLIIVLLNFIIIFFMKPIKINNKIILSVLFITSSLIIGLTFNKNWVKREIPVVDMLRKYVSAKKEHEEFFSIYNKNKDKLIKFDNITNNLDSDKHIFVVIVSDTQNRHHFSIYDYKRETNPYLKSIKESLYIFNDIVASALYTNLAMSHFLTFADTHNGLKNYEAGDIVNFFKSANFKTYWLSAHTLSGVYDKEFSYIGYGADVSFFLDNFESEYIKKSDYDEELVGLFNDAINDETDKNKFIFINMMGSHIPYSKRVPDDFKGFEEYKKIEKGFEKDKQEEIDLYDTSILYSDYVIGQIMEILKKQKEVSYIIFTSDHGGDVYDTYSDRVVPRSVHSVYAPASYEIPFFIWFSDEYKRAYPEVISRVNKSLDKKYQLDRVIHTILDLSRLSHSKYVDSDSIISDNYIEKERTINGNKID